MAPRGKLPVVMALTKKQEEEKEKELEEDPLREDPMWQALQGAGTALHRARGLHGLDRDTSKRWDFMHGASKEMLTVVLRESGYQMPAGSEKWNIEAMRAYVKMQGVNFIPNGYIVKNVSAAVKLQSAFRTFVLRRLIANLKAEKEKEDAKRTTPVKKKTLKEVAKSKSNGMASVVKSAEKKNNQLKSIGAPDVKNGEAIKHTPTKPYISPDKKDLTDTKANSTEKDTGKDIADVVNVINNVKSLTPTGPIIKKSNHHAYLPHLLSEAGKDNDGKHTDGIIDKDDKKVDKSGLHFFNPPNDLDMLERDRLAQQLLTRVESGGISSPVYAEHSETQTVTSLILNRTPPTVEDLHAKEFQRQQSRQANMDGDTMLDMKFEEFDLPYESQPATRYKERPGSAPNRKTLKPVVCTIHTKPGKDKKVNPNSKSRGHSEHVKEGVFRRAMLGRPSSANATKRTSPSRYLSSRYPIIEERRHRSGVNEVDMEAGATWGDCLSNGVRVGGTGAAAVKTLGVSVHTQLNDETLPIGLSGQGSYKRMGKFSCKSNRTKTPYEVEEEQIKKLAELKKTRQKETETRELLGVAMRAQYYHGGILQDYTVERQREAKVTPEKEPKRRGSSRRVSEVNQPSKQYTPLQAEVQPVRTHTNTKSTQDHGDPVTGWSTQPASDFPASTLYIPTKSHKKKSQRPRLSS